MTLHGGNTDLVEMRLAFSYVSDDPFVVRFFGI